VLVGDVAHVGVPEKRKGVVLAQRVEGDGTIDHLADLAVWAAFALGRESRDELGVALVPLRRIEHCAQVPIWGPVGARSIKWHPKRLQDLAHVALEALPVGLTDPARTHALPVATLDVLVAQVADRWVEISFRHQFGCNVSSDRRTSIWPLCIRVS